MQSCEAYSPRAAAPRRRVGRALNRAGFTGTLCAILLICGCGGGSSSAGDPGSGQNSPPPAPAPSPTPPPAAALVLSGQALPPGRVGQSYSATLAASGGTPPYVFSLSSGTLPAGIALDSGRGALTGTPAAAVNGSSLRFTVQDAAKPAQSSSATLALTINPANISVSLSAHRAALTGGQAFVVTATTNDFAGVRFTTDPPATSSLTISQDGRTATFAAPQQDGIWSVRATSVTDSAQSDSASVAVTDLPGVLTWHNDLARDGVNSREYALTPDSVSAPGFGKLFSCSTDGGIYAQPLWMPDLQIGGAAHDVVIVATQHDSVYAVDAEAIPCQLLWRASLIDAAHGAHSGETPVPSSGTAYLVGTGDGDIAPEVGVTGTPVIDPATQTLFVVAKSVSADHGSFYQRLHALDLLSGSERSGSPLLIAASAPGTAAGGHTVGFDSRSQNQRAALALVNGSVYVAWGSHEDAPTFHGWTLAYRYDGSAFTQSARLLTTPDGSDGGIWMSGAAPSADAAGQLYLTTGNGSFDATSPTAPNHDFGDSLLKLDAALDVLQYFTPSNQLNDQQQNNDFGSGGAAVLADLPPGSPVQHLVVTGAKDGGLYLLNRDALGGYGDPNAWQRIQGGTEGDLNSATPGVFYATPAFFNNGLYIVGAGGNLTLYQLDSASGMLTWGGTATAPAGGYAFPGATPSISAQGGAQGIVWTIETSLYCGRGALGCGPAVLHAYDAGNVARELWNSAGKAADAAGNAIKFAVPTIADGRVYIGTRGSNTGSPGSGSVPGELDVYGLQ